MKEFLTECAEKTLQKYGTQLKRTCIVTPNERTKIYFNIALAKLNEGPRWALKMYGIKSLAEKITGLQTNNRIELIFTLYDIFQKNFSKSVDFKYDLDTFYSLGEVLLNDFNEIDNWLVDPEQIFKNIKNIKEIDSLYDHLSGEQKEILHQLRLIYNTQDNSREKKKFLQIWNIIPDLYKKFREVLLKSKKAYSGLVLRRMTEILADNTARLPDYDTFIFIGFNALTKAEIALVKFLMQAGKADYFQDADAYYFYDSKQEAGRFIRKNTRELKLNSENIPEFIPKKNTDSSRVINVYGVPQNTAQAKSVSKLLKNSEKPSEETAVVLANEKLLIPVLNALPSNLKELNISMGVSMQDTKTFGLLRQFLLLHKNDDKKSGIITYSHHPVTALLKHPAVARNQPKATQEYLHDIAKNNLTAVPAGRLIDNAPELFAELFSAIPAQNAGRILLNKILRILFLIFERNENNQLSGNYTLENEAVHAAYKKINQLRERLEQRPENLSLSFTSRLIMKILPEINIPFKGKKATGVQVLGALETRNLDFKNLIILGMNEGSFPKIQNSPSFLTQGIRAAYGLPPIQYQDAVYAYLFYRLLQRSQNVSLVYNNSTAGNQSGEMSRFIKQLQYESGFQLNMHHYYQAIQMKKPEPISIEKNQPVLQAIERFNFLSDSGGERKMLSASAVNTLISCPLQFYFKYIARLRESRQPEDEISPGLFGEILHKAAEIMYRKLSNNRKNALITARVLQNQKSEAENYIRMALDDIFQRNQYSKTLLKGKGRVTLEVLKQYLTLITEADRKYAPFKIFSLEADKNYSASLSTKTPAGRKKVMLGGIIDRVDQKDNTYRIIDYKTGKAIKSVTNFEALFDSQNIRENKSVIQMYIYTWLFKSNTEKSNVQAGIYDLRNMSSPTFSADLNAKKKNSSGSTTADAEFFNESIPFFLEKLKALFSDLFNPSVPFDQTEHVENCEYCPYKSICGRS